MTTVAETYAPLLEIANIGAASAAGALSELLELTVVVDVPEAALLDAGQIEEWWPEPEPWIAIRQEIDGDIQGRIITLLQYGMGDVQHPLDCLLTRSVPPTVTDRATALRETAATMTSAYLDALGQFLGVQMRAGVPHPDLTRPVGCLLAGTAPGADPDAALVFRTNLHREDTEPDVALGCVVLLLDRAATYTLVRAANQLLGIEDEGDAR